jgi:phenylpropionate dioxygenase-like ring-hydroxylating dioxygenase large terminal subunit
VKSPLDFKNFWYVACQSNELKGQPLARRILHEWIVLFRDDHQTAIALQDRCLHRQAQLSQGQCRKGQIQCPYHGWIYNGEGKVITIPSEGDHLEKLPPTKAKKYLTREQDGLIFVQLLENPDYPTTPFKMPHFNEAGYETVSLFNIFENNVLNCAENFIDVPHTVFVHNKIFRKSLNQKVTAVVERKNSSVVVNYLGETSNLGWFSWFLNPRSEPIEHIDTYYAPNVTSVKYGFGKKEFWISSQCVPVDDHQTFVYTYLTFKFGFFNKLAKPFVKYQGQSVINQDINALNNQMQVIKKYGALFLNSTADIIHQYIESLYHEISAGRNPQNISPQKTEIQFWI